MEFPDDVLEIIRAYSKPLMRFSGEFRQILIELGLRDWPEIRAKLCSPDAELVMVALRVYKNVQLEAIFRLKNKQRPMYPRIMSSSRIDHVKCIQLRNKLYHELQLLLGLDENQYNPYRDFQIAFSP
jgi:hypothetical protein